jgi:hypothetical protein
MYPGDEYAKNEIRRTVNMIQEREQDTTWFFIAEGGRGRNHILEDGTDYWSSWPPFRSKEEGQSIMKIYANLGAKGFIYNGPTSNPGSVYYLSYRWLSEMKDEIADIMISTKRLEKFEIEEIKISKEEAIRIALNHPKVAAFLKKHPDAKVATSFNDKWRFWEIRLTENGKEVGIVEIREDGRKFEMGLSETEK